MRSINYARDLSTATSAGDAWSRTGRAGPVDDAHARPRSTLMNFEVKMHIEVDPQFSGMSRTTQLNS
jgi:hypothetical protein